ncbi:MAG: hypothetical protein L0191_12515 [Acidobacteria bacterium]|nr:hypothetical protein [Acidobacteriota bacterium]
MTEASDSTIVFTQQQRLAELAKQAPAMGFTSLNHLLNPTWLREAFRASRTNAAPGSDGQTASDYAANLESNLQSLVDRAKSGCCSCSVSRFRRRGSSTRSTARSHS